MKIATVECSDTDQLREHVRQTLCARQELQPGEYPFVTIPMHRDEQRCGELLIQHGPRLIRLLAVWDQTTSTVHYYDCNGERFRVERIVLTPRRAA